jgi:hypothetical protein
MIEMTTRPTADFSANALRVAFAPVDQDADQSVLFSGTGGALAYFGKDTGVITEAIAPTVVAGNANYAAITNAQLTLGLGITAPFTFISIFKLPAYGLGNQLISASQYRGLDYGLADVDNGIKASVVGMSGYQFTAAVVDRWQWIAYDVNAAGLVTIYMPVGGVVTAVNTFAGTAFVAPNTSIQIGQGAVGQNGAPYEIDVALVNTYINANRPTLARLQVEYKRASIWYNGNGSGVPLLGNTI